MAARTVTTSRLADDDTPPSWLLCRAGGHLCALPLESVMETMRPLPIEPLSHAAAGVLGVCRLRGEPVAVIDAAALFGEPAAQPRRLVSIRTTSRVIALAVDEVIGLRAIPVAELPPLLQGAAGEAVTAIATLDAELLLVLDNARIVPEAVLAAISARDDTP